MYVLKFCIAISFLSPSLLLSLLSVPFPSSPLVPTIRLLLLQRSVFVKSLLSSLPPSLPPSFP